MRILGLDLGVASIGWAVIETDDNKNPRKICGMGSRIIPFNGNTDNAADNFIKGKGETPCSERTRCRQARRNLDRWQLHREQLMRVLVNANIMEENDTFPPLNPEQIWGLRAKAANPAERIELKELARVLFHINHRRGYKHAKSDLGNSKETEHVEKINNRYKVIKETGETVGQYFYRLLKESESKSADGKVHYTYRIKDQVFPRAAYAEETDRILDAQRKYYPEILTELTVHEIKNSIFYQRPLKSCKHLVSFCDFEKRLYPNAQGRLVDAGPRVTPRTSPLAQVCRLYEMINNITLVNQRLKKTAAAQIPSLFEDMEVMPREARKLRYKYELTLEEKTGLFEALNDAETVSGSQILKLLGLTARDGYKFDQYVGKGLKGNSTRCKIKNALSGLPAEKIDNLLKFNLKTEEIVDKSTGEVSEIISTDYLNEPLYRLWHTLYSINDKDELFNVLRKNFAIEDKDVLERLYTLDFTKEGYANKSARFIRRILPHLMEGMKYSEACELVGINHSNSLNKEEVESRPLKEEVSSIMNGSLRQPIVERVLNQMVNVVNAVKAQYGEIDEVRIELARELKQSKEEREKATKAINERERENKALTAEIEELGIRATRRRIQKMRMLKETGCKCIYCGKAVSPVQFIEGHGYEVEHIIPRTVYFDDSLSNKVCACRECNQMKGAKTGYDFMEGRGEQLFNGYKDRVEELFAGKHISGRKRKYLLMSSSEIPQDFIERDLRESQYIARKAKEILSETIRYVYSSSGSVTDFFRHAWGYDTILHDLNLPKYRDAGLTETVEYSTHNQIHKEERVKDWTKRRDHRHHALDALVIALTRQGYVQRLNTLNSSRQGDAEENNGKENLEKWAARQPHFDRKSVMESVDAISVSFKAGKKLCTPGRRYTDTNGVVRKTLVPRAPLHKETVYGIIHIPDGKKDFRFALGNLELVQDKRIADILKNRLSANDMDISKTIKDIKKNPIVLDGMEISKVECFKTEVVVKYPVASLIKKDLPSIIDGRIRSIVEERMMETGTDKKYSQSVADMPLYSDSARSNIIRTVRCRTGISLGSLGVVKRNSDGAPIGYAQTQNNHHVAFYENKDGKVVGIVTSFWECIKRKRYGLPIIVEDPDACWSFLFNLPDNDDAKELASGLPPVDSKFLFSLERNQMVVLGMPDDVWRDAVTHHDTAIVNRYLYRVWKLAENDYNFKFHTDTTAVIAEGDKEVKAYYRITSISALLALTPRLIKIDLLGNLIWLDD